MSPKPSETTTDLEAARSERQRAVERTAKARAEVERLDAALIEVDPEARAFGSLLQERETARARLEALEARELRASVAVADAEEGAERAARVEAEEELALLDAKIATLDRALRAEAVQVLDGLLAKSREVAAVAARANELASRTGQRERRAGLFGFQVGTRAEAAKVLMVST